MINRLKNQSVHTSSSVRKLKYFIDQHGKMKVGGRFQECSVFSFKEKISVTDANSQSGYQAVNRQHRHIFLHWFIFFFLCLWVRVSGITFN